MSSTDPDYAELTGAFFDDFLEPLARTKRGVGFAAYFPLGPDRSAESYFEAPLPVRKMRAADFEFPGGGTAPGLVDALRRHWQAEGEIELASAAPRLGAIADALAQANRPQSADVDIFCYTLF